jgi:hypothetical protein
MHAGDILHQGDNLHPGDKFYQKGGDGTVRVILADDCNLILYDGGTAIWNSHTSNPRGLNACWAAMQGDGNFVLYDANGRAVWSTGTSKHPGAFLALQGDKNLVVYTENMKPLWDAKHQPSRGGGLQWCIFGFGNECGSDGNGVR